MKKMILLFSHKLSEEQAEVAGKSYGVSEFISLPSELQKVWSNVSPDIESISSHLDSIKKFVLENSSNGDTVLIQGDYGFTYNMVNFCKKNNLIPVYATTERLAKEYVKNGESIKKSVFKFRRFREYE